MQGPSPPAAHRPSASVQQVQARHPPRRLLPRCRCRAAPDARAASASSTDHQAGLAARQCRLPSGLVVQMDASRSETLFLYREVVVEQCYLQHGLALRPGDTVVDIGANIGLFTMAAAEAVGASGRVVSVEPAPTAAAALRANLQEHAAWCAARGQQVAPCSIVPVAVSDSHAPQHMQLTVYKRASGWSTLARDDAEVASNMQAYLSNMLSSAAGSAAAQGLSPAQQALLSVASALQQLPLLRGLSGLMARAYARWMLQDAETVTVAVRTVSNIIRDEQLSRVDLLKVDVERAELAVLQGISQHHWPLIRQVAMEVHEIDGRLAEVVALLARHGLARVATPQPARLRGSSLHTVLARRP